MSYDLEKAKQFMEAMKENDEQIAQEWNEYAKRQLNAIFGTEAYYADTDMVYPHNLGALPRNSGRYPWNSDVFPAIDVDISKHKCAITKVIFNDPATIVFWSDGTKTVVKCGETDIYDKEKGLAMAISKKAMGNQGNYYEVFKKWIPELKVDNNASTSETAILSYDGMMKAAQSYGEWFAKEIKNTFDILGIKPSEEVEKND